MEIPSGAFDQLIKAVFYPSDFLDALKAKSTSEPNWQPPTRLWRLAVGLSGLGTLIYGMTLGLAIGEWPFYSSALFCALVYGIGWALFFALFTSQFPRPAWVSRHIAVVVLLFGEMLFEVGAVLNLTFWLTGWLSRVQAIQFNVVWVLLADVTMGVVFVGLLKHCKIGMSRPLVLWAFFNVVVLVVGSFLIPWLGPSFPGGYSF